MNKIQTYYLISRLLSLDNVPENLPGVVNMLQSGNINWNMFVAMGSNHLVLQTLYCKIENNGLKECIPSEIYNHLKYIYTLNCQRNNDVLNQVASINLLLNNEGVDPLYMKGVGNILDGLYKCPGERIMHDIDILVTEDHWNLAYDILKQNGYEKKGEAYNNFRAKEIKHHPLLFHPKYKAYVEIHRLPFDYKYTGQLSTDEIWQNKINITSGNNCYVMSNSHKIIHNFIHSQMVHGGHYYASVFLRNLYDLLLLSERENPEKVFAGMKNYQKEAACYLRIMNEGFGTQTQARHYFSFKEWWYFSRYQTNLRSSKISILFRFILNIYRRYFKMFILATIEKDLRISLIKRLLNRNWYIQHIKSYKRLFMVKMNVHA